MVFSLFFFSVLNPNPQQTYKIDVLLNAPKAFTKLRKDSNCKSQYSSVSGWFRIFACLGELLCEYKPNLDMQGRKI